MKDRTCPCRRKALYCFASGRVEAVKYSLVADKLQLTEAFRHMKRIAHWRVPGEQFRLGGGP